MKYMQTNIFKSFGILLICLFLTTSTFGLTQKVDIKKSNIKWQGKKITGEHSGTIGVKDGNLDISNGKITGGKIVIDMQSMVNTDIADDNGKTRLINHLKSDDFFAVTNFPTAELVISNVQDNGKSQTFSGNLTIKGITNPVSFSAVSSVDHSNTVYSGTMTIDRSKYNVKYGSSSFFENLGNKVIYDEFTLDFVLVTE